jgi:hypothetical protein
MTTDIITILEELDDLYFSDQMTEFCAVFIAYFEASNHDRQHELFRQAFIYNSEMLNAEISAMIESQ